MANMIKTQDYPKVPKQIMIADSEMISLPVKVIATNAVTENGRQILKAGMPLAGNLENRNTAFSVSTANPIGILLHDVDVTEGTNNGVVVIFGVVDLEKLESGATALLTSEVKTALVDRGIYFTTGSGNTLS